MYFSFAFVKLAVKPGLCTHLLFIQLGDDTHSLWFYDHNEEILSVSGNLEAVKLLFMTPLFLCCNEVIKHSLFNIYYMLMR